MKLDRLFNVLVLGGAAVGLAACSDNGGGGPSGDGAGGAATGSATSGGAGGTGNGAGGSSEAGGAGGGGETGGAGGAGGAGGGDTGGAGGTGNLVCTAEPDPGDPCGCPCCWATDCLNTEECCEAFCALGNGGLGCCGG